MGIGVVTFPQELGVRRYGRVPKQRKGSEMPTHSLCSSPEPTCVICCDYSATSMPRGKTVLFNLAQDRSSALLNVDVVLIEVVVGFNCDCKNYQHT